jgi:transcriptional regulator
VSGANQWGIPDWTKEDEYPNQHKAGIRGWAWEFLRRWPDYRNFWTQKVKPFIGASGRFINRDADGNFWPHYDELVERFGVDLPSPPQDSVPSCFVSSSLRFFQYDGRDFQRIQLKKCEIAVVIDLARPLPTQFKRARKSAQEQQKLLKPKRLKHARSRAAAYVTYLRILDGEEVGVGSTEMADVLFPKVPNDYPENKR